MRALVAGPGAWRALGPDASGMLEIALGAGGYARMGADGWFLVAPARAPFGPLTLAVAGLGRVRAEPGWPIRLEGDVLEIGPHRIRLAGVQEARSCSVTALGGTLAPPAGPPPATLLSGVRALATGDVVRAVALLAGRGEGLTPVGDDVLAGFAGWMAAAGAPVPMSRLAHDRSPPISLAYLRCAERGELPVAAVRLVDALAAGDRAAAARRARVLRRWGGSSGRGLIWGFAAAVQLRSSGAASASSNASLAPSPICV